MTQGAPTFEVAGVSGEGSAKTVEAKARTAAEARANMVTVELTVELRK